MELKVKSFARCGVVLNKRPIQADFIFTPKGSVGIAVQCRRKAYNDKHKDELIFDCDVNVLVELRFKCSSDSASEVTFGPNEFGDPPKVIQHKPDREKAILAPLCIPFDQEVVYCSAGFTLSPKVVADKSKMKDCFENIRVALRRATWESVPPVVFNHK